MTEKHRNIIGPVDYVIVKFPGNKFTGKIAPELADLEKNGVIRVIDLVFMHKDELGNLAIVEAKNLQGEAAEAYREIAKYTDEWFSEADIEVFSSSLENNCSAAILLYENVWAIKFKESLIEAEAELVNMGRIHPDIIAKVEAQLNAGGY